ncbi:MAG: DNA/RNA non-specific endonuclease [Muribaculaceae bacterium]|nr:DNA/RNA non-specific endonuclease [Muribaculaceae bacterium]
MKRGISALLVLAMVVGSTSLLADTGVLVHKKDGKTTFFPYSNVEYIEFVDDYTPEDPEIPGNDPSVDPPNDEDNSVPEIYTYPLSYVKLPESTPQQVKEYTGFTVNYNKDNHTPNYVAWELLQTETTGSTSRQNNYWVDKGMEGCLSTDYAYSTYKYERGHMCPAADQKWSDAAMKDCMVMTNMCPQLSSLNGGIWSKLEDKERSWAARDGAIWIVAGPLYSESDTLYVGDAQARVASSYFKAFLYIDTVEPRAIAFVFQNGSNPGNIQDYAMSIDDLEALTGYDFFPSLPDEIENVVEAKYNYSSWDN